MKDLKIYIPLACIALITLMSATLKSNGSPGKKTGSPLDGNSCVQCHSGSASSVNWISTTIPQTGYIPGETYVITTEATGSTPRIGFEITAENNVAKQGAFAVTNSSRTKLADGSRAVTHTISGLTPTNGKNTWNMTWTAPQKGTGEVTFYAAFNVADANGRTSGDQIFTSTLKVSENVSTHIGSVERSALRVYPNPTNGSFNIQSEDQILFVEVFNLTGQQISQKSNINTSSLPMDLSDKNPGLYVVKVGTNKGEYYQKVQVQ